MYAKPKLANYLVYSNCLGILSRKCEGRNGSTVGPQINPERRLLFLWSFSCSPRVRVVLSLHILWFPPTVKINMQIGGLARLNYPWV